MKPAYKLALVASVSLASSAHAQVAPVTAQVTETTPSGMSLT